MIGIAAIRLSSISPAVTGSHCPVGVVNRRRTSFHLQRCRSHYADLLIMPTRSAELLVAAA